MSTRVDAQGDQLDSFLGISGFGKANRSYGASGLELGTRDRRSNLIAGHGCFAVGLPLKFGTCGDRGC